MHSTWNMLNRNAFWVESYVVLPFQTTNSRTEYLGKFLLSWVHSLYSLRRFLNPWCLARSASQCLSKWWCSYQDMLSSQALVGCLGYPQCGSPTGIGSLHARLAVAFVQWLRLQCLYTKWFVVLLVWCAATCGHMNLSYTGLDVRRCTGLQAQLGNEGRYHFRASSGDLRPGSSGDFSLNIQN